MGIQVYLVEAAGRECSYPILPPLVLLQKEIGATDVVLLYCGEGWMGALPCPCIRFS